MGKKGIIFIVIVVAVILILYFSNQASAAENEKLSGSQALGETGLLNYDALLKQAAQDFSTGTLDRVLYLAPNSTYTNVMVYDATKGGLGGERKRNPNVSWTSREVEFANKFFATNKSVNNNTIAFNYALSALALDETQQKELSLFITEFGAKFKSLYGIDLNTYRAPNPPVWKEDSIDAVSDIKNYAGGIIDNPVKGTVKVVSDAADTVSSWFGF